MAAAVASGVQCSIQLRRTIRLFSAEGKPVRYIRSMFVPGEAHCMCLFEAPSPDLVREVNEAAQIPFTRVSEAVDLTP